MEFSFRITNSSGDIITVDDLLFDSVEEFKKINPSFEIMSFFRDEHSAFTKHSKVFFTSDAYEFTFKNNLTGEILNSLTVCKDEKYIKAGRGILWDKMDEKPIDDFWFEWSVKEVKLSKPHIFIPHDNNIYDIDFIIARLENSTIRDKLFFLMENSLMFFQVYDAYGNVILYTRIAKNSEEIVENFKSSLFEMKNSLEKIFDHYEGNFS